MTKKKESMEKKKELMKTIKKALKTWEGQRNDIVGIPQAMSVVAYEVFNMMKESLKEEIKQEMLENLKSVTSTQKA